MNVTTYVDREIMSSRTAADAPMVIVEFHSFPMVAKVIIFLKEFMLG